jgi:hypothetical protein
MQRHQTEDEQQGRVQSVGLDSKPKGYTVLLGKALAEVLAYLTELPLLCGNVETCGLGAAVQLLMSGSAGTCVGQDGQLRRWVHDALAKDAWEGGGSSSPAGQRLISLSLQPGFQGDDVITVRNAALATQATMATAAEPAGKVPRVMAVFSSSHFDERRWQAAVGQEAAIPIINVANFIW